MALASSFLFFTLRKQRPPLHHPSGGTPPCIGGKLPVAAQLGYFVQQCLFGGRAVPTGVARQVGDLRSFTAGNEARAEFGHVDDRIFGFSR